MLSEIVEWAFHWVLLYMAFELGKRWNEKDVAASIAAITETQSPRRSSETAVTPVKLSPVSISANNRTEGALGEVRRRQPLRF